MFFFLYSLLVEFSFQSMSSLRPSEAKSSLTVRNSKLQTAFDFNVLKSEKPSFFFLSLFFLPQPSRKDNCFFFLFVMYLVPVHSGSFLPSVLPVSPLLFFCPHFILILCVSPASRCSPSEGNAAMIPPNLVILTAGRSRLWHDLLRSPLIKAAARWRPARRGLLSVGKCLSPHLPL